MGRLSFYSNRCVPIGVLLLLRFHVSPLGVSCFPFYWHWLPSRRETFNCYQRLQTLCCVLSAGGTGLAVFLVEQAARARRHKTRLQSTSANTMYRVSCFSSVGFHVVPFLSVTRFVRTCALQRRCRKAWLRQGVLRRPLAFLPERHPTVTPDVGEAACRFLGPLALDLDFGFECMCDLCDTAEVAN